jgi:streptogramin lyase
VWVAVPEDTAGAVVVIDPATDTVDGPPIPVALGQRQLSYGERAVWVENTSPASMMRIDPVTGSASVAPTIEMLGEPARAGVLAAYGSIWDVGAHELGRLDPRSGRLATQIALPRARQVVGGDGELWVLAEPVSRTSSVFTPVKGTARLW